MAVLPPTKRTNTSDPAVMKARINRGGKEALKYPRDLDSMPNFFSINLREYQGLANNPVGVSTGVNKQIDRAIFGTQSPDAMIGGEYIHLPIPINGLEDKFAIDYNSASLGAIGGVGSAIKDMVNNPLSIVGNVLSGVGTVARNVGESAAGALGDVVGMGKEASAAAELAAGQINNPNLATLFKGVGIRSHSFSWRMIAYDSGETDQIDQIVTLLKQRALPKRSLGANFSLNYPYVAYLYLVGPKNNAMLTFSEKGCFITNIKVSYNGQQNRPAFFAGTNSPVEVQLDLSFVERSIVTSDDVGG